MRMGTKRCVVLVLTGMLGMSVAACGAEGDDGKESGEGGTGLTSALSGVPASAGEQTLTYRDVDAGRRLVAADKALYAGLGDFGIWELSGRRTTAATAKKSYGFTAKDVDTSLMVGAGQAQRLTGTFDVEAARRALEKDGYRSSDKDGGVRLSKQGQATFDVSGSVRITKWLDSGPVLPLERPEHSVADDAAYKSVSACLGDDVYEASLYGKRPGYRKQGVTLAGIGGRAHGSASTEKLCVLSTSKDTAGKIAKKLRARTATGERYAGSTVNVGDGDTPMVSMTWKNSTKSGLRPTDQDRTNDLLKNVLWTWR
ncbi:hypothetical protein [Streptomyces sp. NPDC006552]|uniref:hypothetical protein n=1 Tax=Streptomyces sp. NPDC006552 TaxID=3157179 RepID=UPI0033BD0D09